MKDWRLIVEKALRIARTPLFVFSEVDVEAAVSELLHASTRAKVNGLPVRHWLSLKTQPLPDLLRSWSNAGRSVEVVSEFELLAACAEGVDAERILVNGVAKHRWLAGWTQPGLRVHFDSLREVRSLLACVKQGQWRIGLRLHVSQEHDPDDPEFGGQFGLTASECAEAYELLGNAGADVEGVHFHLRSNVETPELYAQAIDEVRIVCETLELKPRYMDCGGGIPAPGECTPEGKERRFDVERFFGAVQRACEGLPSLEELWLENGRYVTSRAGVLVVTVVDIKERDEGRYLICDGGRTNHALVSDWGVHPITVHPERRGNVVNPTTICGPTCMAFDRLCRIGLPSDVAVGDKIIWHNAGAYHLPWETRFSHGLAPVVWHGIDGDTRVVREREDFGRWWPNVGTKAGNLQKVSGEDV